MSKTQILDGCMGALLIARCEVPRSDEVWSGIALIKRKFHPEIIKCHRDYIKAGANFITTCNYPVTSSAIFTDVNLVVCVDA